MPKSSHFYCITVLILLVTLKANSQTNVFPTDGDVGIGTLSPLKKLHVVGSGLFTNDLTVDYGTTNRRLKLTDNGLFMSRSSDGTFQSTIEAPDNAIHYNTRSNHRFYVNSILTYDISDTYSKINVPTSIGGVVNGDPSFTLFVGNAYSSLANNGILLENRKAGSNGKNFLYFNLTSGNSNNIGAGQDVGFLGFNTVSNIVGVSNSQVITSGGSQFSLVDFAFRMYKSDGTYAERMRFTSDGYLGIGTSTPAAPLHVNGPIKSTSSTGTINIASDLSRPGDVIRVGGNVNVGDGQNIVLSSSSDGGGTYKRIILERDGYIGIATANNTQGWTVGNPALRFTPDGRVMIGSTQMFFGREGGPYNCSSLLTYVSNDNEWTTGQGTYPTGQNYYYFGTILQTPEVTTKRAPLYIGGRELRFMIGGAGNIGQPGTEAVKISETGDVGIGTTTPTAQLHTTGTVKFAGLANDNTQSRVLVSDANGSVAYRDASTLGGSGTSGWALNGNSIAPGQSIGTANNEDLVIITNGSPSMIVGKNGQVAIGMPSFAGGTSTGYKLYVEQGIRTRKVKVDVGSWPDYVFHKSYQLPTLEEVEKFIKTHQHLPEVPSADNVAKDGLDLGDNQSILLKKIEELTLYVIEQNKKIEQMQSRIQELETNMSKKK